MSNETHNTALEDQLLYKLGSVEALVTNGMRRIDEQLSTLVSTLETNRKSNETELSDLKKRVTELESWRTYSKARIGGIVLIMTIVWAIWARPLQVLLNGPY